jgi:hypothetical protein
LVVRADVRAFHRLFSLSVNDNAALVQVPQVVHSQIDYYPDPGEAIVTVSRTIRKGFL